MEPSNSSYEMEIKKEDEKEVKAKPPLTAGKIFYKPGVIEEETDETSVFESSVVESPMLGFSASGLLRSRTMHPVGSLHRIPTYSSSIGQSTIYRVDGCR